MKDILKYDFSQFLEVVELVNGQQSLLVDILKNTPRLKGIFFGPPEAIETIRHSVDDVLRQRCEFIKGDFFTSLLPSGYQVFLLKDIVDPGGKNQAIDFLKRCHQATETYTRFLIIETDNDGNPDKTARLQKIRALYADIFNESGFILTNVISSDRTDIIEILRM
jgi:hypothetical protein